MDPRSQYVQAVTRRHFFGRGALGLGTAALASLLPGQATSAAVRRSPTGGLPDLPHFAPKAKRAIYLFMAGAPCQMDMLDYKPKVTELARLQAEESYMITNMRHEVAQINEPTRRLLLLLDGSLDHTQLLDKMMEMVQKSELILKEDEVEITDEDKQQQYIQQFLEKILNELGRRALLIN